MFLSGQGWNPQKWEENIGAINVAVFYWLCREMNVSCAVRRRPLA